jgi:hypothetical protein
MTGRITRLIDDQQCGTIAGEDGLDYAFQSDALVGLEFGALHVGARVTFRPTGGGTLRAAGIRLAPPDVERPR